MGPRCLAVVADAAAMSMAGTDNSASQSVAISTAFCSPVLGCYSVLSLPDSRSIPLPVFP